MRNRFCSIRSCHGGLLCPRPKRPVDVPRQVRTVMSGSPQRLTKCLLIFLAFGLLFSACNGGGDGDGGASEVSIHIDSPTEGNLTVYTTVPLRGTVRREGGEYPSRVVTWSNGRDSGSTELQVFCILVCFGSFDTEVPLSPGSNTITVTYMGARASVTLFRFLSVRGRVTSPGGEEVSDIQIDLSGTEYQAASRTNSNGEYAFINARSETYTIVPSLPRPQSSSCFSFSPSSRTIDVTTADVGDQDFTATPLTPCYEISGRVAPSTNPTWGTPDVWVLLTDTNGANQVFVTEAGGMYAFRHLAAGTYTITIRHCYLDSWLVYVCALSTPASRTITITDVDVTGQDFLWDPPPRP